MTHRLIFYPEIPDDLTSAIDYYDKISTSLGDRFRTEVNQRFDDIATRPESFPLDVPPIRFAKIHRFPYLVFFSVEPEFVSVTAIAHGSSEPKDWRDRLR